MKFYTNYSRADSVARSACAFVFNGNRISNVSYSIS